MPNRFDWNALDLKIAQAMEEYPELDRTKALSSVAMSTILGIDSEDAVDSITDGGFDRGIDAMYIDDSDGRADIHLWQTKCVDRFERSNRNFPSNEIDKISSFVTDLTGADSAALANTNTELTNKISAALAVLGSPNASIKVHFVGNMESMVQTELERIQAVFDRYRAVTFDMHNLETLADYFLERNLPRFDRTVAVVDVNHFERSDRNLKGFVCTVAASEIVKAIRSEQDPNSVELGIFDQNVRVFLTPRNRINGSIIDSALSDENHMFWYLNNGITITCDRLTVGPARRAPSVQMENFQIVNGGQTSSCLFEAYKTSPERLEDVVLLLRIIETADEDVKHSIAESTNSQTPINVRDLKSNDRIQRQMEINFIDLGYYYERKLGQHAEQNRSVRIDALAAGQAYLCYGLGLPETAKKDRGRVFGNLYETIFNETLTANMLLTATRLVAAISEEKRGVRARLKADNPAEAGEMALIDGAFHVLFAIRQICIRDRLDYWDYSKRPA